ncbi:alpha-amylase family glycosyl hydrolase [Acidimangrovimonas pyrenivorans]|uniref:Alpha-amylase family glycosyl hydrolase n=1 Tax=Acidimangrovimonas pyrenivorans TaxID=2030798 RepID=A0ABV7AE94_9RHOB
MNDWWRGAVIYQIYPRSFQDSDGDGIGDLPGITRRLDHVAALGADAIWLSPFFASPMADMGYDVSDYTAVDPLFGRMADFDALVRRAHALGLKVIIDQVLSHSSDRHPWFAESRADRDNPKADWYVWADPLANGAPPNDWLSVFGGPAWAWEPRRRQYYLHNFLAAQPDLNFHCPEVQDALLDTMRFWLDRGVDGFRLDTVNFYFHDKKLRSNPPAPLRAGEDWPPGNPYDMQLHRYSKNQPENIAFLQRMRALLDGYDGRMLVGEVGDAHNAVALMADYTRGTDRLHMAYSFEMLGPQFTAAHFRDTVEGFYKAAPDGWPCWSFSNHDVIRHVTRWAEHGSSRTALARQAAALLAGFQGTLCLYQGEELGQTETELSYEELTDPVGLTFWPDNKGRDGCRTPMVWEAEAPAAGFSTGTPWLPVKPAQQAHAVSTQGKGSVLEAYRDLLAFRRATPALVSGETTFLALPEPLLGFWRDGPEPVLCLYNLSPAPRALTLTGDARLIGPSQASLSKTSLALPGNGFAFLAPPPGAARPGLTPA